MAGHLIDGLRAIADRAPLTAQTDVPVHADCHWGNWLARDGSVTALLDFEWARFGEPADDWLFLARFSGPHVDLVLDVIADATATGQETLRAQCEVREAAHLASDLRSGLERPDRPTGMIADRLRALGELIVGRYWWRGQIKPVLSRQHESHGQLQLRAAGVRASACAVRVARCPLRNTITFNPPKRCP